MTNMISQTKVSNQIVTALYCPKGHLRAGSNLVLHRSNSGDPTKRKRSCRLCYNAYAREWNKRNSVKVHAADSRSKKSRGEKYRAAVFMHYGAYCHCCGETELRFLTIEHVGGGGTEHRKRRSHAALLFLDIIREGFPDKYSVLCYNCNMTRRWEKQCPHEVEARDAMSLVGLC